MTNTINRFSESEALPSGGTTLPDGGFHGGTTLPDGGFHGGTTLPDGGFH